MVMQETICKCDICGKEMRESETGHSRWHGNLILGSNLDGTYLRKYDDVCVDCCLAIEDVIDVRSGKSVLNRYFSSKLREIENK